MNDIRVDIKFRNNALLSHIEQDAGNMCAFAKKHKIHYAAIQALVSFKEKPIDSKGWLRRVPIKLCEILGVLPEDLWPDEISELQLETNRKSFTVSKEQARALTAAQDPLDLLEQEEETQELYQLLECLTPRERSVITRRAGLEDGEEATLTTLAEERDVTKERIRQIEVKALRKLKIAAGQEAR